MKKRVLMLLAVIFFLLGLLPVSSFSQQRPCNNHPYKLFCERRLSQFSKFPVTTDAIVFLGDSLIDEGRWEEIFPDLKTFNRGVLSDRTEHVLARLDQISEGQPYMIFIMIGTNDLKFGIRQETIISNYRKILRSIKNKSPNTKVFVQSLLPRKSNFQKRIKKINANLMALAEESGYTYIDLYPAFLDKDGSLKNEYSNDDLHLLGSGYLKWKELIQPYIKLDK
jgi:lysophospholipase L1-like esterase